MPMPTCTYERIYACKGYLCRQRTKEGKKYGQDSVHIKTFPRMKEHWQNKANPAEVFNQGVAAT